MGNIGSFNIFELQKKRWLKEIEKSGMTLISYREKFSEDRGHTKSYKRFIKSIISDRFKPDYWQIYEMSYKNRRYAYVQPYSSYFTLSGEFHTFLSGAFPEAIILSHKSWLKNGIWLSENMTYADQLNEDKALRQIVKKVRFVWQLGIILVKNGWTVQGYNIDETRAKIGMRAGVFGIFSNRTGFDVFNEMVDFFDVKLDHSGDAQRPFKMMTYDDLVHPLLDLPIKQALKKQSFNVDYAEIIKKAVTPYLGRKVLLHLTEKKAERFRKYVMPESRAHDPIVAAISKSGSKRGIVFTSNHCFIKMRGVELAFRMDDILDFQEAETYEGNHMKLVLTNEIVELPISFYEDSAQIFYDIVKQKFQ